MNSPTPKQTLRRTIASVVLVILVLVIGVQGFKALKAMAKPAEKGVSTPPLTRVDVLTLERQDYQEKLQGYGRVRALRQTVVSAEIQGLVRKISPSLEAGAHVEAGTVLVSIDDRDYRESLGRHQATLTQNESELERQKADIQSQETQLKISNQELELSMKELARRIQMKVNKVASADEVDRQRRATTAVELSKLRIENNVKLGTINVQRLESMMASTQLDIQRAERDIQRCTLTVPYAGVIESRVVQVGSRVTLGSELFRVVDPSVVEIPITLPATYYGDVPLGADVKLIGSDINEQTWSAKIERISPSVSAADRTFQVFVVVAETKTKKAPTPGAFLKAEILGALRTSVYVIPRTAFLDDLVLVLGKDQEDKKAIVEGLALTIDRILPDVALTSDARAEGRDVVLNNLERIASGSTVEVLTRKTGQIVGASAK
ncbi:MAG: RND family efflux transporter MFP subunit [Planctomycetota bacterium]|jgi:RND family efflux transporter MFP subunit